jgi:hypothetical protein
MIDSSTRPAFDDDWRVACPEGHVRLQPAASTATAYCESCERSYAWTALVDRKATAANR